LLTPEWDLSGRLANYRANGCFRARPASETVSLQAGDVVLIRTGTSEFWGEGVDDRAKIGEHDSAGIDIDAAK
jgi:hypothetical protein